MRVCRCGASIVGLSDTFRYRLKHDHSRLHDSVPTLLFSWMSCSGGILDHAPYGAAHALRLAGHRRLPNLLSAPTVILAQSSHPAWDLPRPAVGRLYRRRSRCFFRSAAKTNQRNRSVTVDRPA